MPQPRTSTALRLVLNSNQINRLAFCHHHQHRRCHPRHHRFPVSVRPDITTQLMIKCPDVRPDDGYNLKDMMNAMQFVISSKPAIDLLAPTTPLQPSMPAPVPQPPMAAYVTPAAATPYVPDLPSSYAAQPYQQRLQYDGCTFCGASDHAIAACAIKAEYACLGKIKWPHTAP